MRFYVSNGNGESAASPSVERMRAFLDGLDSADEEHGAAWLANDDEDAALEYEVSGNLCFSRGRRERHLARVSKEKVLQLWLSLSRGEMAELEREAWQPGTRPPMPPEERAARARDMAAAQLASDRKFYDALGSERPGTLCRAPACTRGSVSLSVFCRRHHFESICRRECPFND